MTDNQLIKTAYHAALLAQNASAAFWSEENRDFLIDQMRENLADILNNMESDDDQ